jgi:uncharacterized protein YchJ
MKPVLKAMVFVLSSAVVLTALGTATFIGFGALLARWLPLSLFQSSCLAIGAALAVAAVIHVITAMMQARQAYDFHNDFEEEDEDDFDMTTDGTPVFANPHFSKTRKNDYCPCGSGQKFKNCCEHSTVN